MRARAPKEDPQAVADRNKARRQAELDQTATLQDDAAILTDEMRKIYGFRNLGRRGATVAAIAAATAAAPAAATAPARETAMDRQQQLAAMGGAPTKPPPTTTSKAGMTNGSLSGTKSLNVTGMKVGNYDLGWDALPLYQKTRVNPNQKDRPTGGSKAGMRNGSLSGTKSLSTSTRKP